MTIVQSPQSWIKQTFFIGIIAALTAGGGSGGGGGKEPRQRRREADCEPEGKGENGERHREQQARP